MENKKEVKYDWIHEDGSIIREEHDKNYYKNTKEDISKILSDALKQYHNDDKLSVYEKNNNILYSKETVFCIKNVTPGGRDQTYPDEFRIQQKASDWNEAFQLAKTEEKKGVLLGIYYTEDLSNPIICTWKLQESEKLNSISKQVHSEAISNALKKGFSQEKTKNEYVCVFRKEFLFFYLDNLTWLHDKPLSELNNINEKDNETTQPSSILGINRIYFGAPGTGKSYQIKKFIQNNGISDYQSNKFNEDVFRITLHPEYTYNDFIGQIMPTIDNSKIEYKFSPGIFTLALKKAIQNQKQNKPVFLILEEMSRADISSVFGDLFQLLDRNSKGESEYSINNSLVANEVFEDSKTPIFIPYNLFIIGTANLNDQNVNVIDTAFKRRFEFNYVGVKVIPDINDYKFTLNKSGNNLEISWLNLIKVLNEFIVTSEEYGGLGLSEDKQVGQFFIKFSDNNIYNWNQIKGKLLHYLWNDVENIAFSENKIFSHDIKSFGHLYSQAEQKVNFFSEEFLNKFKESQNE